MRYYTGLGDQGTTDLLGDRVAKNDAIVEILGTLDEATSSIGLARAYTAGSDIDSVLLEVQRDLYRVLAELAFTDDIRPDAYRLGADRVAWLEQTTDDLGRRFDLPPHFILPGDTIAGAALDVARTVVRRAERRAVDLQDIGRLSNPEIIRYLNRLSSLLFIAARHEDYRAGRPSTPAKPSSAT